MKVYIKKIDSLNSDELSKVKKLYPNRYQKAYAYQNENDQLLSLAATFLLCKVFPNQDENNLIYSKEGKPSYQNELDFNMSHSGSIACLVVGNQNIGIDIELMNEKNLKIIDKVFTENEKALLERDPLLTFHILWTLKEAFSKCVGEGLNLILKKIDISDFINKSSLVYENQTYYAKTIQIENYCISVVSLEIINQLELVYC